MQTENIHNHNDTTSNFLEQTFVVLDLETTGLDTENDTIIEIAAIRFKLERKDNGTWGVRDVEERSMLIDPERELSEEISLITHITANMLANKPVWNEVKERVQDFIGRSIIVGHNVLFDVAMLKTHDIDLSNHIILDTFELSELFSTECESLNLGFLCSAYGITTDKGEHRALGDTEICLGLFLYYINQAKLKDARELSILRLIATKEKKNNIGFFLEIIGEKEGEIYSFDKDIFRPKEMSNILEKDNSPERYTTPSIVSLGSNTNGESELLKHEVGKHNNIHLLTTGYKISESTKNLLESLGVTCTIGVQRNKWCSIEYIDECIIHNHLWERKLSILLGRILIWIEKTETGLLSELKIYGKEYEYIDNFRMEEYECNSFTAIYEKSIRDSRVVLYDAYDYIQMNHSIPECLIVKDIGLIDDRIRRALSFTINITSLIDDVNFLIQDHIMRDKLMHALSLIQHIYEGIPERPKGENEFPPGNFGETYFFDQAELWKMGGIWLSIATKIISYYLNDLHIHDSFSITIRKKWESFITSLKYLVEYHKYISGCSSIIIEIGTQGTVIRYIPRSLSTVIGNLITQGSKQHTMLYGFGIGGKKVTQFLHNEYSINGISTEQASSKKELQVMDTIEPLLISGGVILTTNMKNIREIGKICERRGFNVLMQGISGGKGKIQSLFEKNIESTILIGLIDTWKDEERIWKIAKNIIIAKLPFDPPSDPYFLARTVGISNNFSLYSEPMVILRINTLIGHLRTIGYTGPIYTLDTRLHSTIWGNGIYQELL